MAEDSILGYKGRHAERLQCQACIGSLGGVNLAGILRGDRAHKMEFLWKCLSLGFVDEFQVGKHLGKSHRGCEVPATIPEPASEVGLVSSGQ